MQRAAIALLGLARNLLPVAISAPDPDVAAVVFTTGDAGEFFHPQGAVDPGCVRGVAPAL
jgi:hypothetical protein